MSNLVKRKLNVENKVLESLSDYLVDSLFAYAYIAVTIVDVFIAKTSPREIFEIDSKSLLQT